MIRSLAGNAAAGTAPAMRSRSTVATAVVERAPRSPRGTGEAPASPRGTLVVGASPTEARYRMMIEESARSAAGTGAQQTRLAADAAGGWMVLLQHSAGSVDAAVTQIRRRNLLLSFGILGVLAASAGLIVVNARRAEKLASQQMEFVATVSHELRTPLAVIRSAAQNLSAGVVHDTTQARQYGELIETEGRRLTDMVEQVLEYAGLSDARRRAGARPIDAAAVARDVAGAIASLPEAADVAIDVSAEPNLPPVFADADAVRRALHNLMGNALKYAADGRWIGVTVSRGQGADAGFVLTSVADRGRGIPAADLARVFEPFYRGRRAIDQQIRGNGLGLSLVKRIAEAAGGRVTVKSRASRASEPRERSGADGVPASERVEGSAGAKPGFSEENSGTTFTLYLPVAAGAQAAAEEAPQAAPDSSAAGSSHPA
jgi:signal transduction histidine kinase